MSDFRTLNHLFKLQKVSLLRTPLSKTLIFNPFPASDDLLPRPKGLGFKPSARYARSKKRRKAAKNPKNF